MNLFFEAIISGVIVLKVLFIGLNSAFTEGMTYQDNLLANQVRSDGHDVTVIADCHEYVDGVLVQTAEEDKCLTNGIRLRRLRYRNVLGRVTSGKIRAVKGLYEILEIEQPDIIFHHGVQSWELLTVAKYKKNNSYLKLFVDNHADLNNSATTFLSRNVLHKIFYRRIVQLALPYIDKVFFVAHECGDFLKDLYNVPDHMMEFYPLGGVVPKAQERQERRTRIRQELNLREQDILLVHSGKMDALKRTEELLKAFLHVPNDNLRLVLIGYLDEEVKEQVEPIILADDRISFLGWKTGAELLDYLCACDLYMQPGSQSATMQNALCCGSAVALFPHRSYKYLLNDSAFWVETVDDMTQLLQNISDNPESLRKKQEAGQKVAKEQLDYRVLANRLYA